MSQINELILLYYKTTNYTDMFISEFIEWIYTNLIVSLMHLALFITQNYIMRVYLFSRDIVIFNIKYLDGQV